MDVNAEEDPNLTGQFAYPDSIAYAQSVVPEANFGFDNRGSLTAWIPVIDGNDLDGDGYDSLTAALIGDLPDADSFEIDFTNPSDSNPQRYVTEWVDPSVVSTQYVDYLRFNLHAWETCVHIDDAIPDDYQPYMAWNTDQVLVPRGGLTRLRMDNIVGRRDNALYLGYTMGTPPEPELDFTGPPLGQPSIPTNAAMLGSGGPPDPDNVDSKNYLGWANPRQYHVLVWEADLDSGLYSPHSDGRGELEQPHFPDAKPEAGTNTWMYLGFVKDGLTTWGDSVACSELDFEWYYVDGVWLWGTEIDPPTSIDVRTLNFVMEDDATWIPLSDSIQEGTEARVCLVSQGLSSDSQVSPPVPVLESLRYQKENSDGLVSEFTFLPHQAESFPHPDGGDRYIHCPLAAEWVFDYCGVGCTHTFTGTIAKYPGEVDPSNNVEEHTATISSVCPVPSQTLP